MNVRELIERYNAAWNAQDLATIHEFHDPGIVFHNHTADECAEGADAVRDHIARIFARTPDLRFATRSLRTGDDFAVWRVDGVRHPGRPDGRMGRRPPSTGPAFCFNRDSPRTLVYPIVGVLPGRVKMKPIPTSATAPTAVSTSLSVFDFRVAASCSARV